MDRLHLGLLLYITPERYEAYGPGSKEEKREVAKKSDDFSYGVLLWEVRERECPFKGMPTKAIQFKITSGCKLPDGSEHAPPFYNRLLNDCTASDPEIRPSFRDINEAFSRQDFSELAGEDDSFCM
eukprot:m.216233 g.216233  ORF g.216233 m.216233 type:complete len:126 (+) comp39854_c0_seq17:2212-2589(+)